jgi:hypothetical protein
MIRRTNNHVHSQPPSAAPQAPRNPPAHELLLLANQAQRLADASLQHADSPDQLALSRDATLLSIWRLKVAHKPFLQHNPHVGLRNFPFSGWSPVIEQLASNIYNAFFDLYMKFLCECIDLGQSNPDHPIFAAWFPAPSASGSESIADPHSMPESYFPDRILVGRLEARFTAHHLKPIDQIPLGSERDNRVSCITDHAADRLFTVLADAVAQNRVLRWDGYRLEHRVWHEGSADLVPSQERDSASCDITPPNLILRKPGEAPIVRGRPKKPLTHCQYKVLRALADAAPNRLSLESLTEKSKISDVRGVLTRLRKADPDYAAVIDMAGAAGVGYGIRQ